jgi:hypothetical protein
MLSKMLVASSVPLCLCGEIVFIHLAFVRAHLAANDSGQ